MKSEILEQLRGQTRPAHMALETQPLLKRLLSADQTRTEYGQLLQAMLAFYQGLEMELVPATEALIDRYPDSDYRYLPRAPLLVSDCQSLGLTGKAQAVGLPEISLDGSDTRLLGILYVIEGSAQGGRMIARHLERSLDITMHTGGGFFAIPLQEKSWPAFRRWSGANFSYTREGLNNC
jgi:heme oxygenase